MIIIGGGVIKHHICNANLMVCNSADSDKYNPPKKIEEESLGFNQLQLFVDPVLCMCVPVYIRSKSH